MSVVEVEGLVKVLGGRRVLDGVSLRLVEGEVFVLAGPNGSGKTTTLRVLMGLYRPDAGRVRVLGVEPGGSGWLRVLDRVGYLPEDAMPYDRLTGYENLYFYARLLSRGDPRRARELVEEAVRISGLSAEDLGRRAGSYSRGMKRRLLLGATLMHSPRLAVLDEPTAGLDVFSSYRVREIIRRTADNGGAVLVTTHNLLEAQIIADRVAFLASGRVVFVGGVDEALAEYGAGDLEEAFVRAVAGGR